MKVPRRPLTAVAVLAAAIVAGCSAGATGTTPVTVTATPSSPATATPTTSNPEPSPGPSTLKEAYEAVKEGVVRLQSYGCDVSVGTGFAIRDNQVVTAAHVVERTDEVRAIVGTTSTRATVVGLDSGRDVALLVLDSPLDEVLRLSDADAEVGDQVGVIGFTAGQGVSLKPGTVNGLDRKAIISGATRYGLVELDSVAAGGNSGGPLVTPEGSVVGLLDAGPSDDADGQRLAVPASTITELVDAWTATPEPVDTGGGCGMVLDPYGEPVDPTDDEPTEPTPEVLSAVHALDIYFWALNTGDYATAASQLADVPPLDRFADAVRSSYDSGFDITGYRMVEDHPQIDMSFVSEQEAGRGPADRPEETCTLWTLRYDFEEHDGMWFIAGSHGVDGADKSEPCPWASGE